MHIHISISEQVLYLKNSKKIIAKYSISTALKGIGSGVGSFQTPLGKFCIAEKIGDGMPLYTLFQSRKPIGIWLPEFKKVNFFPEIDPALNLGDDLILSRILWLNGLEEGNANTYSRYIYIHGTNHEDKIGHPVSQGCIRMNNENLLSLFPLVDVGTKVEITD